MYPRKVVALLQKANPLLSYSTVVLYRDHEGLGFLAPKYHPKTSYNTLWHLGRIGVTIDRRIMKIATQ